TAPKGDRRRSRPISAPSSSRKPGFKGAGEGGYGFSLALSRGGAAPGQAADAVAELRRLPRLRQQRPEPGALPGGGDRCGEGAHIDDAQLGTQALGLAGERPAVEAGHEDVGDEKGDRRIAGDLEQRVHAVAGT